MEKLKKMRAILESLYKTSSELNKFGIFPHEIEIKLNDNSFDRMSNELRGIDLSGKSSQITLFYAGVRYEIVRHNTLSSVNGGEVIDLEK